MLYDDLHVCCRVTARNTRDRTVQWRSQEVEVGRESQSPLPSPLHRLPFGAPPPGALSPSPSAPLLRPQKKFVIRHLQFAKSRKLFTKFGHI